MGDEGEGDYENRYRGGKFLKIFALVRGRGEGMRSLRGLRNNMFLLLLLLYPESQG